MVVCWRLRRFVTVTVAIKKSDSGWIDTLLASLQQAENPHVELITLVCLATGARWGEAEGLTRQRVHQGMVTFTDTKNGRNRSVPVPQWLYDRLQDATRFNPLSGKSPHSFYTDDKKRA